MFVCKEDVEHYLCRSMQPTRNSFYLSCFTFLNFILHATCNMHSLKLQEASIHTGWTDVITALMGFWSTFGKNNKNATNRNCFNPFSIHRQSLTMKLVKPSQMIQQCFQRLWDWKKLQKAVDHNVKDGKEAKAHVAKVDWQVLRLELHWRVDLVGKALKIQLLWVFLVREIHFFFNFTATW